MTALRIDFDNPVPYAIGLVLQEALVELRAAGTIPDTFLFLEHAPVVTLGNRGRTNHLLADRAHLEACGIELHHASRGGDVTFHGPGQLIMYPILQLGRTRGDSRSYLTNLEEIAIRTAKSFGVDAFRREGKNGAWHQSGKIAAIGFRIKRWVTCHGMSFNLNVDLAGFSTIVPCGLVGEPVSSLARILGPSAPSMSKLRDAMASHASEVLQRPMTSFEPARDTLIANLLGEPRRS